LFVFRNPGGGGWLPRGGWLHNTAKQNLSHIYGDGGAVFNVICQILRQAMNAFRDLVFAFAKTVLSYKYTTPVYSDSDFNETCPVTFLAGGSFTAGATFPVRCQIPSELTAISTAIGSMDWTVSSHGFHTAFNLSFSPSIDTDECLSVLYIPSTSFLDVGDAKDRELPAPQPPKFHYLSTKETFFEVQHRYQPLDGSGRVVIHPPILFCGNEIVPVRRPEPFWQKLPIPTVLHSRMVFGVTFILPIVAGVFQLAVLARAH
jgi:hypothetical protein